MNIILDVRALSAGIVAMVVLGACSQGAPPTSDSGVPTSAAETATAVGTLDPRFNATAAVGGGINASNAVPADDIKAAFASVPQIDQLKLTVNSSPPGARGQDVTSASIAAQDTGGLLNAMDGAGRRALAESILNAAASAWPRASLTLLISAAAGGSGPIIGTHQPGGANSVIGA
jgi:hypothetical protein